MRFALVFSLLTFALTFNSSTFAQSANPSSPTVQDAVSKGGEAFENYYKFVVFIDNGRPARLVYQNLEQFELHQQFLATLPAFKGLTRDQIDAITYRNDNDARVAFTGVLTIHAGDDGIHRSRFSLAMAEVPTVEVVIQIAALIRQSSDNLGDSLDFEVLPHQKSGFAGSVIALKNKGIEVFSSHDDPASVSYTEGWNTGVLEIVENQDELDAKFKRGQIGPNTVILAKTSLREFPTVAGVISAVPLTPASHTVLLAQMYGVPVVYFKDAAVKFGGHAGQRVFLSANGDPRQRIDNRLGDAAFNLTDADVAALAQLRARKNVSFQFKPSPTAIVNPTTLTRADVGAYGGKGSQTGTLMRMIPKQAPNPALVIPLSMSVQFINSAKASTGQTLRAYIDAQLATLDAVNGAAPVVATDAQLEIVTANIRREIQGAELPASVTNPIAELLNSTFTGDSVKLRLRSSSNVEDGTEFNGAGLYDSEGYWLRGKKTGDLAKNLKSVISSLYTKRAYSARHSFGVDEQKIGMGILIHRAFEHEVGNGVIRFMVNKEHDRAEFEIITLPGEDEQVTHAGNETAPEIVDGMSSLKDNSDPVVRVVQAYQGFSKERMLFPESIYRQLGALMAEVSKDYVVNGQPTDIESEFKLMPATDGGAPAIYIKQVRPVPHPAGGRLNDGSTFIVLGGDLKLQARKVNNNNAYADLALPKHIEMTLNSFTEKDLRSNRVTVAQVRYQIGGKNVVLDHPSAIATVTDGEYQSYSVTIALGVPGFPSMKLELSHSGEFVSHSVNGAGMYFELKVADADMGIFKGARLNSGMQQSFETIDNASEVASAAHGTVEIVSSTVKILGTDVSFYGEGDGHAVAIGQAEIRGVFPRSLHIPASGIGYGANHHEGQESFIFDLQTDPSLSATDRQKLEKDCGRYLYAAPIATPGGGEGDEDDEGGSGKSVKAEDEVARLMSIHANGKIKPLGTWTLKENKD